MHETGAKWRQAVRTGRGQLDPALNSATSSRVHEPPLHQVRTGFQGDVPLEHRARWPTSRAGRPRRAAAGATPIGGGRRLHPPAAGAMRTPAVVARGDLDAAAHWQEISGRRPGADWSEPRMGTVAQRSGRVPGKHAVGGVAPRTARAGATPRPPWSDRRTRLLACTSRAGHVAGAEPGNNSAPPPYQVGAPVCSPPQSAEARTAPITGSSPLAATDGQQAGNPGDQ